MSCKANLHVFVHTGNNRPWIHTCECGRGTWRRPCLACGSTSWRWAAIVLGYECSDCFDAKDEAA